MGTTTHSGNDALFKIVCILILSTCLFLMACEKENPELSKTSTFIKIFGGARNQTGSDVKATSDGGYVLLGSSNSFSGSDMDMFLIKVDAQGNEQWSKNFGRSKDDFGNAVLVTRDNGYVLLGTTTDEKDSTNILLIKVSGDGEVIWEQIIGNRGFNERGRNIKEDLDGNGYIIVGSTTRLDYGKYPSNASVPDSDVTDAIVIRTDLQGNVVLSRTQGFNGPDIAHDVLPIKNLNNADEYMFVGTTTKYSDGRPVNGSEIRIFKNNKSLGSNVDFTHGGERNETGISICETTDGGFAILGSTASFGNGGDDIFMVKLKLSRENEITNIQNYTFGGSGDDRGVSIQQLPDGNFILLGTTQSFGNGGSDIYMIKINNAGEEVWSRTFGEEGNELASRIIATPDGGFAIIGTLRFGSNDMVYFIKTNSEGLLSNLNI